MCIHQNQAFYSGVGLDYGESGDSYHSGTFETLRSGALLNSLALSGLPGTETTTTKELLISIQSHSKEIEVGLQMSLRKGWNQGPKCSRAPSPNTLPPSSAPANPLSPSYHPVCLIHSVLSRPSIPALSIFEAESGHPQL